MTSNAPSHDAAVHVEIASVGTRTHIDRHVHMRNLHEGVLCLLDRCCCRFLLDNRLGKLRCQQTPRRQNECDKNSF